ncbi:sigma-70 family RNA polymerase sigma factor [Oscillospiraceae bacterium OttesenSCG-928-G22]|nr:sigma-70 family RNA polymerase sigma factor [Oscillospiraceae bacterium OttesenSCG-928-G22]
MDHSKLKNKADCLGVGVDVYLFLRQSNRKLRYFACDLKRERIIIDGERVTFVPSREDSLDRLWEDAGVEFAAEEKSVEDIVVESMLAEQLHAAIARLDEGERRLIEEIFFSRDGEGKSEREAAETLGIAGMTLHDRKTKTLAKLRKALEPQK